MTVMPMMIFLKVYCLLALVLTLTCSGTSFCLFLAGVEDVPEQLLSIFSWSWQILFSCLSMRSITSARSLLVFPKIVITDCSAGCSTATLGRLGVTVLLTSERTGESRFRPVLSCSTVSASSSTYGIIVKVNYSFIINKKKKDTSAESISLTGLS